MKNILLILCLSYSLFGFNQYSINLIKDINIGDQNFESGTSNGVEFDGWYYFSGHDSIHGNELWKIRNDSCILVHDIFEGSDSFGNINSSFPNHLTVYDNKLYFTAQDSIEGFELWEYDGISPPHLVTWLTPVNMLFPISNLIVYNGKLLFNYRTSFSNPLKLMSFDGVIATLIPGDYLNMHKMFEFNSKLYGVADGSWGVSLNSYLWEYDGITIDTVSNVSITDPVLGLNNEIEIGHDNYFDIFQNILYFAAFDPVHGYELWQYDGINASLAIDTNPGIGNGNRGIIKTYNNILYYNGNDGVHGEELMSFDGINTSLVQDVDLTNNMAVTYSGGPSSFEIFDDILFFTHSNNNIYNSEPWYYNGSNIINLVDLYPGNTNSSNSHGYKVIGPYMYFIGNDGIQNSTFWRVESCNIQNTSVANIESCNSYISPSGNVYTSNGTYHDTITNTCGEDSIITTHLTINLLDNSTTITNYTISANQSNANYQWLNCENNSEIPGAVNQLYAPNFNGDYAVVITNNETGCSDTSDCVTISGLAIPNQNTIDITVYPNPSKGIININGLTHLNHTEISIYNTLGQSIPFKINEKGSTYQIELNHEAGLYFIQIKNNQGVFEKRVVLE